MLSGVTLHNFLVVGLMASVFIVLAKFAASRSNIQGLQSFFGAV